MILLKFQCDECSITANGDPPVVLHGDFASGNAGILLPRKEWHFCSKDCTEKWLRKAKLRLE